MTDYPPITTPRDREANKRAPRPCGKCRKMTKNLYCPRRGDIFLVTEPAICLECLQSAAEAELEETTL